LNSEIMPVKERNKGKTKGGKEMKGKHIIVLAVALFAGFIVGVAFVGAAEYPTRPITVNVPWPAGGSADTGARILTAIAEMGQPIVVVNRAGPAAGGIELARQKPDGATSERRAPLPNTSSASGRKPPSRLILSFHQSGIRPGITIKAAAYKTLKDLLKTPKAAGEIRPPPGYPRR
jgi:hypothetical protein